VTWAVKFIVIIAAMPLTIHVLVLLYYREVIMSRTWAKIRERGISEQWKSRIFGLCFSIMIMARIFISQFCVVWNNKCICKQGRSTEAPGVIFWLGKWETKGDIW
jgi:hypothetical protein